MWVALLHSNNWSIEHILKSTLETQITWACLTLKAFLTLTEEIIEKVLPYSRAQHGHSIKIAAKLNTINMICIHLEH